MSIFLFRILTFRWNRFCVVLISIFWACNQEGSLSNPCTRHFELESLKPSDYSKVWLPYQTGQNLIFRNNQSETMLFLVDQTNVPLKSDRKVFYVPCYEDSTQLNDVYYTDLSYQTSWINKDSTSNLRSILIERSVIIDDQTSRLDQLNLADILSIRFHLRLPDRSVYEFGVLQFPVFYRGYTHALKSSYSYSSSVEIAGMIFQNVYSNYENNEHLKVYYTENGLVGFELMNGQQFALRN